MVKKKITESGDWYIEIDGIAAGPTITEEEADVVVKWLNLSMLEFNVEENENNA